MVAMGEEEPAGSEKGPAAEAVRGMSGNNSRNNGNNPKVLTPAVSEAVGEAAEGVVAVRRVKSRAIMFAGVLNILPKTARTRSKPYDIAPS
jgi:hypothetical protein